MAPLAAHGPLQQSLAHSIASPRGENSSAEPSGVDSLLCAGGHGGRLRGILVPRFRDGRFSSLGIAPVDRRSRVIPSVRFGPPLPGTRRVRKHDNFRTPVRGHPRPTRKLVSPEVLANVGYFMARYPLPYLSIK